MKLTVPRIMSNLDRDSNSPTYGCFDRNFWHYKIRDFPSMILQQSCRTLAILYKSDYPGNIYYKKKRVKKWALAAVDFWANLPHR